MLCEASERPGSLAETGGGAESFCHDEVQFNHSVGGVLSKSSGYHPSISIPSSGDGDFTAPEYLCVWIDQTGWFLKVEVKLRNLFVELSVFFFLPIFNDEHYYMEL